jgi:hypothetical protein
LIATQNQWDLNACAKIDFQFAAEIQMKIGAGKEETYFFLLEYYT